MPRLNPLDSKASRITHSLQSTNKFIAHVNRYFPPFPPPHSYVPHPTAVKKHITKTPVLKCIPGQIDIFNKPPRRPIGSCILHLIPPPSPIFSPPPPPPPRPPGREYKSITRTYQHYAHFHSSLDGISRDNVFWFLSTAFSQRQQQRQPQRQNRTKKRGSKNSKERGRGCADCAFERVSNL